MSAAEIHFEIVCQLGKRVRTTKKYWQKITQDKHPAMSGKEDLVKQTLMDPNQVRRNSKDPKVYHYYRKFGDHYIRVVVKDLNDEGFVITTFPVAKIGGGELVWQK